MHLSIDGTVNFIVIFKDLAFEGVGKSQGDPLLGREGADVQGLLLLEHFYSQFALGSDEDDELIILNCEGEEYHIVFGVGLDVELEVDVEALGKWPFDAFTDQTNTSFLPIGDEVAIRLALLEPLMFHNLLQHLQGQFQQLVI